MRLLLLGAAATLLLAGGLAACSQNPDKSCALNGCTSNAVVIAQAKTTIDLMRTAKVTACRNGVCASGSPAIVPTVAGDREEMTLVGGESVQAYITPSATGYTIEAVFAIDDSSTATNGDTYELHVTANGAEVGGVKAKAQYTESAPNGAGCPPVCKNATIQ